jgi:hypothetical protein
LIGKTDVDQSTKLEDEPDACRRSYLPLKGNLGITVVRLKLLFFFPDSLPSLFADVARLKGLCVALHDRVMPEAGKQLARQA